MNELFVTLNLYTISVSIITGFLIGILVVRDLAAAMLMAFLHDARINAILRLLPLFIFVFGTFIAFAFYAISIMTDLGTNSPNSVWRAAGRGVCNVIFIWALALGALFTIRRLPHNGEH